MCNKSQGFYGLDGMLSPAAQAVMDAWESEWSKGSFCHEERSVAAALRAAADQVVPDAADYMRAAIASLDWWDAHDQIRAELLGIAAELEVSND
jgi:hypothetical protein